MSKYLYDLWTGVFTVLAGMKVTFVHFFKPTITIQYPRVKKEMFPLSRAQLVNHVEECGYCLGCERACPVDLFTIKGARAEEGEDLGMLPDGKPKKMHIVHFEIDMTKCLFCGLCVDACETGSLRWEQPQQASTFTRQEMISFWSDFATQEERDAMLLREQERKAKAASDRAAKAKKPAAGKKEGGEGEQKTKKMDKPDADAEPAATELKTE